MNIQKWVFYMGNKPFIELNTSGPFKDLRHGYEKQQLN